MKRNNLYIAISFVLASMWACTDDVPPMEQTDKEASRIYLSAGVGEVVSSRTPYHPSKEGDIYVPTMSNPLNVSVWASTNSGVFLHKVDGSSGKPYDGSGDNDEVAIHTTAYFQSAAPQLLGEAVYPKNDTIFNDNGTYEVETNTVFFVGLHPKSETGGSSWKTSNGSDAEFTFTGKEDVMFAPQIFGTYGTDYADSPQFHFHHLLTLLRIEMVADKNEDDIEKKEGVSAAWGKIISLKLIQQPNKVTVSNLGSVTKDNMASNVAYTNAGSNPVDMDLYHTGTDEVFPKNTDMIPVTQQEVAYVMCAPVTGEYKHTVDGEDVHKPEYTLHIVTEKRELNIPIDLRIAATSDRNGDGEITEEDDHQDGYFLGSTVGKQFTIVLNFKMGNVVTVVSEISIGGDTDWFTHGAGSGELTEGDLDVNL